MNPESTHPSEAATLGEMILRCADVYGDHPAVVVDDRSCSYREIAVAAERIAGRLAAEGLRPGDRVALWMPNSIEFPYIVFGAALAGLVAVPLNSRLRREDLIHSLELVQPRALFVSGAAFGRDYLAEAKAAIDASSTLQIPVVVTTGDTGDRTVPSLDRWIAGGPTVTAPGTPVGPGSIALISFTSGTTSRPKGATVSHDGALYIAREAGRRMEVTHQDRMMSPGPFFHNGGLIPTLYKCLMYGCTLYSQASFDPAAMLRTIEDRQCTLAGGVATVFDVLIDEPGFSASAVGSLRAIRTAGPADIRKVMVDAMPHAVLVSLFGMAETSAAITLNRLTDSRDVQITSNGSPIPESEVRIVDPAGEVLGVGQSGEIQIHGRGIMLGYFGDTAATAEVMTADGWLRSGDLGHLDELGNLVLTGRIKDTFRRGGESVACAEVESCLRSHPAVREVAVVGRPDRKFGEVGFAFVQLKETDAAADPEELRSFCAERLANFKVPAGIQFVRIFPLSASGKVDKKRLVIGEEPVASLSGAGV